MSDADDPGDASDHPDPASHPTPDQPVGTPTAVFDVPDEDAHVAYYADPPSDDDRPRTAHLPDKRTHDGLAGSFVTDRHAGDCTVAVDAHPHQREVPVSLDLVGPWATLGVGLEPTEARAVAYSLLHAAAECVES